MPQNIGVSIFLVGPGVSETVRKFHRHPKRLKNGRIRMHTKGYSTSETKASVNQAGFYIERADASENFPKTPCSRPSSGLPLMLRVNESNQMRTNRPVHRMPVDGWN
jgi:hypothetical protein